MGGKKNPIWRVVATDQRSPRDGRFIEVIGHYNAQTSPSTISLDEEQGPLVDRQGRAADGPGAQAHEDPGHQRLTQQAMRELLEDLARALVTDPEAVEVEEFEEDDGTVVLELSVGEDDYGKIIGRGGRTANALRTVIKAAAVQENRRVLIDIVD